MENDPKATLKYVSDCGYNFIESFSGSKGIFWGMGAQGFSDYLSSIGLKCISSHFDPMLTSDLSRSQEFDDLIVEAASIGIQYLVNPWLGFLKEDRLIRKAMIRLSELADVNPAIHILYHHHHLELENRKQGAYIDLLLDLCRSTALKLEVDIYWLYDRGVEPLQFMSAYSELVKLVHIKDRLESKNAEEILKVEKPPDDLFPVNLSCHLGEGCMDVASIVKRIRDDFQIPMIVEQERFTSDPLDSIAVNYSFMKDALVS